MYGCRDHFVYAANQWETTSHCNVVSHWLEAYTKWSLPVVDWHWGKDGNLGIFLFMRPANEKRRYLVTSSVIGWAHTQKDPWRFIDGDPAERIFNPSSAGPVNMRDPKFVITTLAGPWFNIKMTSYQYRKSHCGDKTILRPSYLHNGISYTGKTTSSYWIRAQVS